MRLLATLASAPKRLSRSYAFRSQALYRALLRLLPGAHLPAKPECDIPVLTMCGRDHMLMLEGCLLSMARTWRKLPRLKVVSDGSIGCEAIRRRLRWWPNAIDVVDWSAYLEWHGSRGRDELVAYAKKSPFGRKLSAIAAEAERQCTLWCDTDVLFFDDASRLLEQPKPRTPFVWATQDFRAGGYDPALLDGELRYLLDRPPVNTGLVLACGDFYDEAALADWVARGLERCNGLTEQTILAHAVFRTGRIAWGLDTIEISSDDAFRLRPVGADKGRYARHYLSGGMRHMFWRDALAIRIGLLPRRG